MRSRSGAVLAAMGIALAASSCVSAGDPGVAIENIEADLVFGIEEVPEPVVPANAGIGAVPEGNLTGARELDVSRFRNPAADRLPPLRTTETVVSECPAAPPTAAADAPADVVISGPVREGVYRWKRAGTQLLPNPAGGEPIRQEISGFETRIIRNVQPYDDPFDPDAYTYEMVQTLVDRPVVQVRTFLVKPASTGQLAPGGAYAIDEPRLTEPEAGVSLLKVEEIGEDGSTRGSFEPTNGLLLMALPVDPSEQFVASAIDPKSGQVIMQQSAVRGRGRIDACGDLVDGWRVESTQSRSDAAGDVTYNYLIAPQYGGVPILEEISTVDAEGVETNLTLTLGQLDPDPLSPDGEQP